MAAGRLIRLPPRLRARYRLTPWWGRVLLVFAASRVVTTAILLVAARGQERNQWTDAAPDYWRFASMWDAHWYYIIAMTGYPTALPLTDAGEVGESAWAFMPVYPALVRAGMLLTGAPFGPVAVVVSVAAAAGAVLVIYRLMRRVLPEGSALFAVAVFCFAPLSPVLQVGYAESLHLLLLSTALWLLVSRRYWLLLPVVAVMALTRPSGLAFALALLLHLIVRFVTRRRDPFPWRERIAVVVVGLWSAAWGLAWLLIAAAVTGSLTAYTDTELAWRAAYVGYGELVPFTSWFQGADWWLSWIGVTDALAPWLGAALVLLLVAAFALAMLTPAARRLDTDLRLWVVSYAVYLLAVFFPQSSTFRLLMPMFPLAGALAVPQSRAYRTALIVALVLAQVWWVDIGWEVDGADWTPP